MQSFNGRCLLLDKQPITPVLTNSCYLRAGGIYKGDWFYINWQLDWPAVADFHINSKEVPSVYLAVCRWSHVWSTKHIYVQSDDITTVAAIKRHTSRNPFLMACLRSLFWLSAQYNFHVTARCIPGVSNIFADDISRVHEPYRLSKLCLYVYPSPIGFHMSLTSLSFLFDSSCGQTAIRRFPRSRRINPDSSYIYWVRSAHLPEPPDVLPRFVQSSILLFCPVLYVILADISPS